MAKNAKAQEVEKAQLTSIKERVWKSHAQMRNRRRKQLRDVQPPSTYDIYTMNQTSKALRNSFQLVSPVAKKPDPNAEPSSKPLT